MPPFVVATLANTLSEFVCGGVVYLLMHLCICLANAVYVFVRRCTGVCTCVCVFRYKSYILAASLFGHIFYIQDYTRLTQGHFI